MLHLAREAGIPLVGGASVYGKHFNLTTNRPMEPNLNVPNLGQPEIAINDRESRLGIGETVIPASTTESGISRLLARLGSAKESLICKVYPNSDILEDLAVYSLQRRPFRFQCRQGINLVVQSQTLLLLLPETLSLLQKVIVKPTTFIKGLIHLSMLPLGRIQPVFKTGLMHKYILAQFMKEVKRAFICQLKQTVFSPATK